MFFIETAHAQVAPTQGGGAMMTLLPLIIMIAIFYFLVMRPQIKREQARQQMRASLKRGENVITTGGLIAKITKLEDDNYILVQIADGTEVRLARASVEGVTDTAIPAKKAVAKKKTKKPTPKKKTAKK
mgnify:CR=1 FL=1